MTNQKQFIVDIHGKQYLTVAGRVQMAHESKTLQSIQTEVLTHEPVVLVKATVTTGKGIFTGISAANPSKMIEKMSPYEVAETSAVGRALGFAGFGIIEGIATADEIVKAFPEDTGTIATPPTDERCPKCGEPMFRSQKTGTKYCSALCWKKKS